MIDQLPDERLLSSAGDKAQQRRHVKLEPEDDDTGVHSGMLSSQLVYIIYRDHSCVSSMKKTG